MEIEAMIRDVFEKEVKRVKARVPPYNEDFAVPSDGGKCKKGQHGLCILSIVVAVAVSIILLKTGTLRSPLVTGEVDVLTLTPSNFAAAFFEFMGTIHSFL
jgi:hypothetical protein